MLIEFRIRRKIVLTIAVGNSKKINTRKIFNIIQTIYLAFSFPWNFIQRFNVIEEQLNGFLLKLLLEECKW